MKLNQLGKVTIAISLLASLQTFVSAPATSQEVYKIVGLTSNNTLVNYNINLMLIIVIIENYTTK